MRDTVYLRIAAVALISGAFSGIISAAVSETGISENYGAWFMSFYECTETEIWIKAAYSAPFFAAAIFIAGLFIFGYIFAYPIIFYYGYTFGFLATCTVTCFGASAIPEIVFRLPSMVVTSWILCRNSAISVKFSAEAFSGLEFYELRAKTSKFLWNGLGNVLLSVFPMFYEAILLQKILNLWDSF